MPWRAGPTEESDPYRVWLSEIMLQQTTVATVGPYFERFIALWPTVEALAGAGLDEVLHAWQGLGYYARARNLHTCAAVVAKQFGGRFPGDEQELKRLPGIGGYTAAAIAAIAFGRATVPVDGNVVRVLARLERLEQPLPAARTAIAEVARRFASDDRPGDFAQALMDLGATVCTPRAPACPTCPWKAHCAAAAAGVAEHLPLAAPKKDKPVKHGIAFWAVRPEGSVLLRRRPPKGLLGGMMEIPSTPWRSAPWPLGEAMEEAPFEAVWEPLAGQVRHTFTHFHLRLTVVTTLAGAEAALPADGLWCPADRLDGQALPTLMKKVAKLAGAAI